LFQQQYLRGEKRLSERTTVYTPGLKMLKAYTYFEMCQNDSGPFCKHWITLTLFPNRTCWKKYLQNL